MNHLQRIVAVLCVLGFGSSMEGPPSEPGCLPGRATSSRCIAAPPGEKPPGQKPPEASDALESIERTRGGRHWIDAETEPPAPPEESLGRMSIEPGWTIELVAAEPLVMDPVAIAFDRRGRMFVVEYGDYPSGAPGGGAPLSRVVRLEDTDGDGRVDRRHVFADKLDFAHSLMALDGGILVGAKTQIVFLKDTDGDDKADVREVLFDGFVPAHPQMQIGNPRWGMDNWIYLNYGPGRITSSVAGTKPLDMPRLDFRFHPTTREFGPDGGLGQYGNTFDRWGHRLFCSNRNPVQTAALPQAASRRNPYAVIPKVYYDVSPAGGDARVYPLVKTKSNYLAHAGTYTSACGVTAYSGSRSGGKPEDSVFVCEPIGHLVTRSIVESRGVTLAARRAREKADFLASTDTWFRPVSLANGPDGALYLADMYRLWVEHPKFLPEAIAKRLDWRAGDERGRIYRIVPSEPGRSPGKSARDGTAGKGTAAAGTFVPPASTDAMVNLLSESISWRRQLGQRLLVERQAKAAAPDLRRLLTTARRPETRLHALWTLDGLASLADTDLARALEDDNAYVRRDAVKLAGGVLHREPDWLVRIGRLANDQDVRVRFQVAVALGESDDPRATQWLAGLALRDGDDRWFAAAILTSAKERSGAILAGLTGNRKFAAVGSPQRIDLVRDLATGVGARGDVGELGELLDMLAAPTPASRWWQTAALSGLATGLPRHRGSLGKTSLPKLLAEPPERLARSAKQIDALLRRIDAAALDRSLDLGSRVAAVQLLAYRPHEQTSKSFVALLSAHEPPEVQLACIEAMRTSGTDRAAAIVLQRWPMLGPTARGPALDLLLSRPGTTRQTLEAMAEGRIPASAIGIDRRVALLKHRDPNVRALAIELLGGAVSSDRRQVAAQYQPALRRKGSIAAGAKVFERTCAACHRRDGRGHNVGPDISDLRNRSRDAILLDILDPNRKVEPRYTNYTVVTDDGRTLTGLMISETALVVVLGGADGKQHEIPRTQIEAIRATGKSLMPEGVEKEISVEQMADLLEFLKAAEIAR